MNAVARLAKPIVCTLAFALVSATLGGVRVSSGADVGNLSAAVEAISTPDVPLANSAERERFASLSTWRAPSTSFALAGVTVAFAVTSIRRVDSRTSAADGKLVAPRGLRGYDAAAPPL